MVIVLTWLAGAAPFFAQYLPSSAYSNPDVIHPVPTGVNAAAAAAEAEKEAKTEDPTKKKDRFTYGKRTGAETVETKATTSGIQKTKDGSADVTVPTGVFKESLLDIGLPSGRTAAASPTPSPRINPARTATTTTQFSTSAQPSPSPVASAAPALTASSQLDITLGVSPAPNATATPPSH